MRLKKSVHENTRWVIRMLASRVASARAVRSRDVTPALRLGGAAREVADRSGRPVPARAQLAVEPSEVDEAHDPGHEDRQGEHRDGAERHPCEALVVEGASRQIGPQHRLSANIPRAAAAAGAARRRPPTLPRVHAGASP